MDDATSIRELVETWHRATRDGDVETVLTLMTDDVVFLTPGHEPMRGREAFGAGLKSLLSHSRIESSAKVLEVHAQGDLAYSWSELDVAIVSRDDGRRVSRHGYTLTVLQRNSAGKWQLSRDANLLPPPGPSRE